ncbi:hypothetical protein ACI3LY_002242 [Candidozyma auris]|uniref:Zn(2)-C6 fungal-type domain-containing protein n=1 Tax=Candidozyma auris TaxID=498019 RepID=A0A2H0ZLZ7_CANAR|nr:hypothetical protein B9J08_002930 [[Candida] auris]
MSTSDSRYSKRFRVPVSCSVCRKRKSRCDRAKPVCGSCKKKSIAHLCSYDDDSPESHHQQQQQQQLHQQAAATYLPVGPVLTNQTSSVMVPNPYPSAPATHESSGSNGSSKNMTFHQSQGHHKSPSINFQSPQLPPPQGAPQSPLWGPSPHQYQQQYFIQTDPNHTSSPHLPHHTQSHEHHRHLSTLPSNDQNTTQSDISMPFQHQPNQLNRSSSHQHDRFPAQTPAFQPPPLAQMPSPSRPTHMPGQPSITSSTNFNANVNTQMAAEPTKPHGSQSSYGSGGSKGSIPLPPSIPGVPIGSPKHHSPSRAESMESSAPSLSGLSGPPSVTSKKRKAPGSPSLASASIFPSGSTASKASENASAISIPITSTSTASILEGPARSPQKEKNAMPSNSSRQEKDSPRKEASSTSNEPSPDYVSISIGSNILQIELDDTMDSFSAATNSLLVEGELWQQQGPLSYVGLTKSDPFIKLIRSFSIEIFKSDEFSQFVRRKKPLAGDKSSPASAISATSMDDTSRSEQSDQTFDRHFIEERNSEDETDLLSGGALLTTKIKADETNNSLPFPGPYSEIPGTLSIQSLSSSKRNYYDYVQGQVISILPNKRSLYNAVSRYFKFVATFIPILHEHTFMSEVRSLFGGGFPDFGDGYYKSFFIRDEQDLNLTAQLLLIVRLGYMSLIPTDDSDAAFTKEEKHLIKDITRFKSDHYLSIINLCISEEKIQTRSTFKIVQSLTLLYYYRSVAPNDCLGISGADSQLLFGSIVNHALSIGLNRDPVNYDSIHSISKKADFVNTWRCLWHFIVNTDAMSAMLCGIVLKIPSTDISDVENPKFDKHASEREELFHKTQEICNSYRRVLNKLTNLRDKPKVIDVLRETSNLEGVFLSLFGQDFFRDYICSPAPQHGDGQDAADKKKREECLLKVSRFLTFIHLRASLSCLYYLVVIHYEEKLDKDASAEITAGIELFKIFIRSVVQLVYIMSYALDNSQELFGRHYDFILTSGIERCLIKTHNFVTSFFIRLINYKRALVVQQFSKMANPLASTTEDDDSELEARSEVTDSLFTIAMIEAELFVGSFWTLSKTYINSYKIYVMAYFVLKQCMENPDKLFEGMVNHKKYFHDGTNLLQFLSIGELQSLCKLCEEFRIAKVESIRRQKTRPKGGAANADVDKDEEEGDNFDAMLANRTMYANRNTVNTYGVLQEKHMYRDFEKQAFDEQSMIGNEELLKLFELYGDLDAVMGV